ncbi:MAG: hypothetical protein N3B21_19245 [Clostridia bacterium]|nr:hypothetical protein [Clostridia bacterium]
MQGGETLNKVAEGTNSELIRFFVIVAVILLVLVPTLILYFRYKLKKDLEKFKLENKAESTQFKDWTEREGNLLKVIKENGQSQKEVAEAITKLSVVLEINNKNCDVCKAEQLTKWDKIETDIHALSNDIRVLSNQIDAGMDGNWNLLKEINDKLKKE